MPRSGLIIAPGHDANVEATLNRGCWTPVSTFALVEEEPPEDSNMATADQWHAVDIDPDGGRFTVSLNGRPIGAVDWKLIGRHNVANALAALAAARHAGVPATYGIAALRTFGGVRRRMELIVDRPGLKVYDDFAHHPTAIRSTLEGLRAAVGNERIVAVVEPRTHTMSLGTLRDELTNCCAAADEAIWFQGDNIQWNVAEVAKDSLCRRRWKRTSTDYSTALPDTSPGRPPDPRGNHEQRRIRRHLWAVATTPRWSAVGDGPRSLRRGNGTKCRCWARSPRAVGA